MEDKCYTVGFYRRGNLVATHRTRAIDDDAALVRSEFSIMCHYRNVIYDTIKIIKKED